MKLALPGEVIPDAPGSDGPVVIIDKTTGRVEIYADLDGLERAGRQGHLDEFGMSLWRLVRSAIAKENNGTLHLDV